MTLTFSEYLKLLYPYCNGSSDEEDKSVKSHPDFILALLHAATDDKYKQLSEKSDLDYFTRIFNGKKHLSKRSASYILTNLNKAGFEDNFLNAVPTEDARCELCRSFEPCVGNATKENIATKLADLFVLIMQAIAIGKKEIAIPCAHNSIDYSENEAIECELAKIVDALASIPPEQIDIELRFNPLTIDRKIKQSNTLLTTTIRNDLQFYRYIEGLFKQVSAKNSVLMDMLAKSVQSASDRYMSKYSQNDVFSEMVKWFMHKAMTKDELACRIMVSFFIQNCEVFHEITE